MRSRILNTGVTSPKSGPSRAARATGPGLGFASRCEFAEDACRTGTIDEQQTGPNTASAAAGGSRFGPSRRDGERSCAAPS